MLLLCALSLSQAQSTYIDLTTGNANFGSNDPNWTVATPNSSTNSIGLPAIVVKPIPNAYATNSCGKWISSEAYSSHDPAVVFGGTYTFYHHFDVNLSSCTFEAILDLSFIAADNMVTSILVNGAPIAIPAGIDFDPGVALTADISQHVQNGPSNTIAVVTKNYGTSQQALQICGGITITPTQASGSTVSQTLNVDITTGLYPWPFLNNPKWEVKKPNTTTFIDALNVFPYDGNYATNECGGWIADSRSGAKAAPTTSGDFIFKLEFELPDCIFTDATLQVPFIAADNSISSFQINGNNVTYPGGITFINSGSFSQSVAGFLTAGTNTIEVTVHNTTEVVGLMICGNISIEMECEACAATPPANLRCNNYGGGNYLLDWCDAPDATTYEVEVINGDPACCGSDGDLWGISIEQDAQNGSSFYLQTWSPCFSWRVRSICPNGEMSEWSDVACSCADEFIEEEWGKNGAKDQSGEVESDNAISVYPNPGAGIYSVSFPSDVTYEYKVTTITGQVVIGATKINGNNISIDLTNKPAGIYLLQMSGQNSNEVIKLVKKN